MLAALAAAASTACKERAESGEIAVLDGRASALRSAFNAASEKLRVVALVAPT